MSANPERVSRQPKGVGLTPSGLGFRSRKTVPALEDNHPNSDAVHRPPEFLFGEGIRRVEGDLEEDEGDREHADINVVGRG